MKHLTSAVLALKTHRELLDWGTELLLDVQHAECSKALGSRLLAKLLQPLFNAATLGHDAPAETLLATQAIAFARSWLDSTIPDSKGQRLFAHIDTNGRTVTVCVNRISRPLLTLGLDDRKVKPNPSEIEVGGFISGSGETTGATTIRVAAGPPEPKCKGCGKGPHDVATISNMASLNNLDPDLYVMCFWPGYDPKTKTFTCDGCARNKP